MKKKNVDLDREIRRLRIKAETDPEHRDELLAEADRLEQFRIRSRKRSLGTRDGLAIETAMLKED